MSTHRKPSPRVPETVARPTRTTAQAALAAILVQLWSEHIDRLSRDELAVYSVVALALVNAVWVAVENYLGRGLMRQVTPKVPVVD